MSIRDRTHNFVCYYYPRGFNENTYEIIINDLRILNEAFAYSLKLKSLALIEYILNSWEKLYISPSINEKQISPLLIEHTDENVQQILRFIVTKDIIIVNDGSLKLEESMIEDEKSEKDNEIMFISTNQSKFWTNKTGNQMDHNEAFEKPITNNKTVVEIEDPVLF